jgi:hypothetical protein
LLGYEATQMGNREERERLLARRERDGVAPDAGFGMSADQRAQLVRELVERVTSPSFTVGRALAALRRKVVQLRGHVERVEITGSFALPEKGDRS